MLPGPLHAHPTQPSSWTSVVPPRWADLRGTQAFLVSRPLLSYALSLGSREPSGGATWNSSRPLRNGLASQSPSLKGLPESIFKVGHPWDFKGFPQSKVIASSLKPPHTQLKKYKAFGVGAWGQETWEFCISTILPVGVTLSKSSPSRLLLLFTA